MGVKVNKRDVVRKFMTENPQYKDKKEIARQVMEQHPNLFKSLERARFVVREVTGAAGNRSRNVLKTPKLTKFFYNGFEKWASENLNEELQPWDEPFTIPNSIKELSVIADLHSVHMDKNVMLKFLRQQKNKEAVLINGDLMDSESLSRHLKGHNLIAYEAELELCHQILKGLKEEFNHVYFKLGNHDFWLERYLLINAREVFRALGVELSTLLRCGELGVHHIHNLKYIQYGDLDIVHGHEFPGYGLAKFPATSILDKWQTFKHQYDVKIMCSHAHRKDISMSKKSKDGKFGQGWVTPAFCRKGAGYAPYAGWDNGWAVVRNNEGVTSVEIVEV